MKKCVLISRFFYVAGSCLCFVFLVQHKHFQLLRKDKTMTDVCSKLVQGNVQQVNESLHYTLRHPRTERMLETYSSYTDDCVSYVKETGFIVDGVSNEEKEFPIAFSILVFTHVAQLEHLLRAIYRPQNVYCIHVDKKCSGAFHTAARSIAKCLTNVFVAENPVKVYWSKFSVLEAELICLKELLKHEVRWKYFINLTGQEFPLKTNYELVKILKVYRGANDISGTYKNANKQRWHNIKKVPHGTVPRKGSAHIAASRDYIEYIMTNQTALDFLQWVKQTAFSDETFFATLNYNPHLKVPGSYKGEVDDGKRIWLTRYKIWMFARNPCSGIVVHSLCIFGVGDLQRLTKAPQLFANKFHFDFQPLALDCLSEWYFDKVASERITGVESTLDLTEYRTRHFINNSFTHK